MIYIKTLELTSDIVFKSFMLSKNTNKFKAKLINSITGIPIDALVKATYTSKELTSSHSKDKNFRTDIVITIDSHIISLEMNKWLYLDLITKNLMYLSRTSGSHLEYGNDYRHYKKIVQINLDINNKFQKPFSKFMMFESTTNELEKLSSDELKELLNN